MQQQLVVRILAHRAVEKFDLAAMRFELFEQQHLMDIIARQPVGRGQHHPIDAALPYGIAQTIQPGAVQLRAAVTVVTVDVLIRQANVVGLLQMGPQAIELLLDGLLMDLVRGRYPHIHGNSHHASPLRTEAEAQPGTGSSPAATGRLDPTAADRPATSSSAGESAIGVS